jgi:hypothetical protein
MYFMFWNDDFTIFKWLSITYVLVIHIGIILTDGLAMILFMITI